MRIRSNQVTPDFLDTLKIKDKAYFISLEDYKGFRIKVNPSGRISFVTYARIKGGGKPRTITHGSKNKLPFEYSFPPHTIFLIHCESIFFVHYLFYKELNLFHHQTKSFEYK